MQIREDIETEIEDYKEKIFKLRYEFRSFHFGARIFWIELITSYRKQADSYRRWFIVTQIIVILLSTTVTSLSGGWIDKYISIPWTIPVFSALISILTSFTLFFKLREKGTNLQQTADAMDLEHKACNLSIGPYKGLSRDEALILLAERTETLRK